MKYFKSIENGYLFAVSTNLGMVEISEAEYNSIRTIIQNRPAPPDGYDYRLRADNLTWELFELPPAPVEDGEADAADYETALTELGVNV